MAEQLEFFEIKSPCRNICQMNEQGYCIGCFRSRDERFKWFTLTNEQKRNVLRLCYQRSRRVATSKNSQDEQLPIQQTLF
ncbi:DUF1289 domain-containing protein [Providencia sneebia]|uniref:Oxidoreductase n=1 Tax=Providencia sneebia DSM 19967 TaxID=1141660 RepID=K8WMN7_9GAMM|nr:DUF1289 domain-containing protein [Providencia sneebia]EKT57410.1 hypothetical protein OO7_08475 [Providencia sneebia DSM 19967]